MTDDLARDKQNLNEFLSRMEKQPSKNFHDILGIHKRAQGYRFDFFNRPIFYNHNDFIDLSGEELSGSIKAVFSKYMINCPQFPLESSGKLLTFRELPGAGPLFQRFAENTNKTIEQSFSNRLGDLEIICKGIYGMPINETSFDLSIRFKALPKIPIILHFNDVDDTFPANAVFLFHDDAIQYLDLKSLGSIATYLTGSLINNQTV